MKVLMVLTSHDQLGDTGDSLGGEAGSFAYVGRCAPAHDETGHMWQHSDEDIFAMTKYGRFASAPAGNKSYMPGFRDQLSDHDILAAMAFIKVRWPLGLRVAQAMLNPGHYGMPAGADKEDWKFPPTCKAAVRQLNASEQRHGT